MKFAAKRHGEIVAKFPETKDMSTGITYKRFNKFCKSHGYTEQNHSDPESFGYTSWSRPGIPADNIKLVRIDERSAE